MAAADKFKAIQTGVSLAAGLLGVGGFFGLGFGVLGNDTACSIKSVRGPKHL
jgi:hypothetical protein